MTSSTIHFLTVPSFPPRITPHRYRNARGWWLIERQAESDERAIPAPRPSWGHVDLAIQAAIHDWPQNRDLLERTNARARIHGRSSYLYCAPLREVRDRLRVPTPALLAEARDQLTDHFINRGLIEGERRKGATEVIPYDFEKELWLLIRYPGRRSRHCGYGDDGGWKHYVFNPENYDALAYSKVFGDLRINARSKRDQIAYRVMAGHLLFDEANVFSPAERVVRLDPIRGDQAADLFHRDDLPDLARIIPVQVTYDEWGLPMREHTVKMKEGDSLLTGNTLGSRLIPRDAFPTQLVLQYTLRQRSCGGRLVIQPGNKVSYERDGDSDIIEEWLRLRGFVKTAILPAHRRSA